MLLKKWYTCSCDINISNAYACVLFLIHEVLYIIIIHLIHAIISILTVAKIKLMCSEVMIEKSLKGLKVKSIPGRRRPIAK